MVEKEKRIIDKTTIILPKLPKCEIKALCVISIPFKLLDIMAASEVKITKAVAVQIKKVVI